MATLFEIIRDCRVELDDLSGDVDDPCSWEDDDTGLLWSNSELTRFANAAEREFCRRTPIRDSDTADICTHSVALGQDTITYDRRIQFVERIKVAGETRELKKRTKEWIDDNFADWETNTGTPLYYIENFTQKTARLFPTPDADITLNLTVGRLPLEDMVWDHRAVIEPEIDLMSHEDLILWMNHLALRKRDSQTYNKSESDRYFQLFETASGPRISSWMERRRADLRALPRRTKPQPR